MYSEGRPTTETLLSSSPDVGQYCLENGDRFPTPLNDLGLVDKEALIALVRSNVDPEFKWASDKRPDCHHLYWQRSLYPDTPNESVNLAEFRELPSNKIVVPVPFHGLLHKVTEKPPVPEKEVVYNQIQAHHITQELFKNAWQAMRLERARWISDERLVRGRDYHLEQSQLLAEKARDIPKEFQPIDFDGFQPSTIEEVRNSARQLGQVVVGASNLVRYIRLSAA